MSISFVFTKFIVLPLGCSNTSIIMNFKLTPRPYLRKFLRVGSIFTASLLLVFATTAFKPNLKNPNIIVAVKIQTSASFPDGSEVDYTIYNGGTVVGSGTICAGGYSAKYNSSTTHVIFGPAGNGSASTMFSGNTAIYIAATYVNYISCPAPGFPKSNLEALGSLSTGGVQTYELH